MNYVHIKREGQAMILTVLALGGAVMGATAIAGLLLLNQISATTDSNHSAKAIFAADAGVNWALYDYFCSATSTQNPGTRCINPGGEQPQPVLGNEENITVTCYDASNNVLSGCANASATFAISIGTSLTSKRAFSLNLLGETSTAP